VLEAPSLHREPPVSPARVLRPWAVSVAASALGVLGAAAAEDRTSILLTWDRPIRNWVTDHRTGWLDTIFGHATDLGSTTTVVVGLALLLVLVQRRCYLVAGALAATLATRPALEAFLKGAVDRERPRLGRMMEAGSSSFPSGHTLGAVLVWGLVPPVVALLTHRRALWWAATVAAGVAIAVVAASRVYLGVHWFSDVVGSIVAGALVLVGIEWALDVGHRRRPCHGCRASAVRNAPCSGVVPRGSFPIPPRSS
jgi:membrane-associated phospholipid phosphatase